MGAAGPPRGGRPGRQGALAAGGWWGQQDRTGRHGLRAGSGQTGLGAAVIPRPGSRLLSPLAGWAPGSWDLGVAGVLLAVIKKQRAAWGMLGRC